MANCYIDPNATLSWDALFPYVLPYVLGVPNELMAHNIRLSAIEFCRRSGILHDENTFEMQAGVSDFFLTTICDYEIVRIVEVSMCGCYHFRPTLHKPMNNCFCGPYGFWMENVDVLHLSKPFPGFQTQPQPNNPANKHLRVEFVVQPKQDGCTLDNYLYEYWAEGIAYGAIHRLMMIPNVKWFNPQLAQAYQLKFRNEIVRARTANDLNFI